MGGGESLVRGERVKTHRLRVVGRDAFAEVVFQRQHVLGLGVALVGGLSVPRDGLRIVLRRAFAPVYMRPDWYCATA